MKKEMIDIIHEWIYEKADLYECYAIKEWSSNRESFLKLK